MVCQIDFGRNLKTSIGSIRSLFHIFHYFGFFQLISFFILSNQDGNQIISFFLISKSKFPTDFFSKYSISSVENLRGLFFWKLLLAFARVINFRMQNCRINCLLSKIFYLHNRRMIDKTSWKTGIGVASITNPKDSNP